MSEEEIIKIKNDDKTIVLESEQFSLLRNESLESIIEVLWNHQTRKLQLQKINNTGIINPLNVLEIKAFKYLLLNPSQKGH